MYLKPITFLLKPQDRSEYNICAKNEINYMKKTYKIFRIGMAKNIWYIIAYNLSLVLSKLKINPIVGTNSHVHVLIIYNTI